MGGRYSKQVLQVNVSASDSDQWRQ